MDNETIIPRASMKTGAKVAIIIFLILSIIALVVECITSFAMVDLAHNVNETTSDPDSSAEESLGQGIGLVVGLVILLPVALIAGVVNFVSSAIGLSVSATNYKKYKALFALITLVAFVAFMVAAIAVPAVSLSMISSN